MKLSKTMTMLSAVATVAAFSALASSCVVRQYPAAKRSVSVRGTGSVAAEADRALIQLSVITSAPEAGAAAALNAEQMKRVQDAILAAVGTHGAAGTNAGASTERLSISTANYSIYQESNYNNGVRVLGDYRVSNDIKVYLMETELASTIIDAAIKAGANNLSSLTFSVSNPGDAIRQARTKAVQNARDAARVIAGTAGAELGRVLEIKELADGAPRTYKAAAYNDLYMAEAASDGAGADTPVTSGKIDFTVSVDATFELK